MIQLFCGYFFEFNLSVAAVEGIILVIALRILSVMNIKKYLLGLSSALIIGATPFAAQADTKAAAVPFGVGDNTLGFSIGFGTVYGSHGNNVSPAFALHYDHGTIGNVGPGTVGFGGILGFQNSYTRYNNNNNKQTWSNVFLGFRSTYHLAVGQSPKFDPYGGITLGARISSSSGEGPNNNSVDYTDTHFYAAVFIGAKYNFSQKFGGFMELGNDVAIFRIGVHTNF